MRHYMEYLEAFTSPLKISAQLVIAMNRIQRLTLKQRSRDDFEFLKILAATLTPFDIFFELTGVDQLQHQIPS